MVCDDPFIFSEIRELFDYKNKAARYSEYAKPIQNPITPLGSYKVGMTEKIIKVAKRFDNKIELDPLLKEYINPLTITELTRVPNEEFELEFWFP